jgi:hypothetical protein
MRRILYVLICIAELAAFYYLWRYLMTGISTQFGFGMFCGFLVYLALLAVYEHRLLRDRPELQTSLNPFTMHRHALFPWRGRLFRVVFTAVILFGFSIAVFAFVVYLTTAGIGPGFRSGMIIGASILGGLFWLAGGKRLIVETAEAAADHREAWRREALRRQESSRPT